MTRFFSIYGLALLGKNQKRAISPLGNPAMPMKMPFGPKRFRQLEWKRPNALMAGMPGFESAATGLMQKTLKNHGVAPIAELRAACLDTGVKFIGCQMTAALFGGESEAFIPDIAQWAGAAVYLDSVRDSDTARFV